MIINNINIDNTILIKNLCNKIICGFNNNNNNNNNNNIELQEFISNHINSLKSDYKKELYDEYSDKCINKNILNKLNNKYDGDDNDRLTLICYSIVKDYYL